MHIAAADALPCTVKVPHIVVAWSKISLVFFAPTEVPNAWRIRGRQPGSVGHSHTFNSAPERRSIIRRFWSKRAVPRQAAKIERQNIVLSRPKSNDNLVRVPLKFCSVERTKRRGIPLGHAARRVWVAFAKARPVPCEDIERPQVPHVCKLAFVPAAKHIHL